jgi:hypothetical protein
MDEKIEGNYLFLIYEGISNYMMQKYGKISNKFLSIWYFESFLYFEIQVIL